MITLAKLSLLALPLLSLFSPCRCEIVTLPDTSTHDSAVIVLDDSNFEHDTQSSSGMTTGSWLVEFYAPWCGHCKSLKPIWDEVAKVLKEEQINVAKVDCTVNKATAKRFDIRGYPTIKLLHKNKIYDFEGERTKDPLVDWTLSITHLNYKSKYDFPTPKSQNIPKPIGSYDIFIDSIAELGYDVETIAMKKPAACVLIGLIGFLLGALTTLILMTVCLDYASKPLIMTRNGQLVPPNQWKMNSHPGFESPPDSPKPQETLGETLHQRSNSQSQNLKTQNENEKLTEKPINEGNRETLLRQRK